MKKILGLIAGMLLTVATFAQEGVRFTDAGAGYNKATTTSFHFNFTGAYTMEDIQKSAEFYTNYFTVTPVANATTGGIDVTITLVEDTEMNRRIVGRFFVTMEVEAIIIGDSKLLVADFVSQYVML